ncbi:Fc.00g105290.m01.CDS01 [Cosmosporella sp. VM-42]
MAWARNTPEGTPTEAPTITGIIVTFTGLSLLFVCLRLYVRGLLIKAMGKDDWIIIVSWIGACGYTICTVIQTTWGLGLTSLDDMPPENVYNFGLVQYIGAPFYVVGIFAFKMSLLLSYLRFLIGGYRIATLVVAAIITMAHIAFMGVFLFLCTPVSKQWDPAITGGHCAEGVPFYLSFSSLTIVFDAVVLVLPFPALLKSKIQRRKKVVLLGLFGLGIFVTIIQIIRIRTIQSLTNYLDSSKPILWSIIETNIGIIIACVPTLAPLVKYFAEKTRNGTSTGSNKLDSRYALQTWKSGMRPLGSGIDHEAEIGTGPKIDDDSTENILMPVGITKRTDVVVTRQHAPSSNESL